MIFSAVDFIRAKQAASPRPWLVVGKGPTSDYICRIDPAEYHVLTLNHACKIVTPAVAHFVDLEAYEDCVPTLAGTDAAVCMPWYPHTHNRPGTHNLFDLGLPKTTLSLLGHQLLLAVEREKKLIGYNASTASNLKGSTKLPNIKLRYFSAVAAFNLLAASGVREAHTLGVDGGIGYGDAFDKKDCLSNGQASFDVGIREIVRTVSTTGMRWLKLGQMLDTLEKKS